MICVRLSKRGTRNRFEANAPKEEIYITAKEAAKMLGVTLSTLWRWDNDKYLEKIQDRQQGKIPPVGC